MTALIDSHCHLEPGDFIRQDGDRAIDERGEILDRARAAGVVGFVCIGSGKSLAEVENAVGFAHAHDDIWAGIGIHPHDVARHSPAEFDLILTRIAALAQGDPRVAVVGETGLDYYYKHSPPEAQQAALRQFLAIARAAHKPVSLHIRDAHEDAQRILAEEEVGDFGGVVHCFTGTPDDADRYVALGLHVSFSGVVTFKSAEPIRQAAQRVPADRILVETDCPYLAPIPMRGRRNEPAYVVHTAAHLATVRGVSVDELAAQTTANARRLFRLMAARQP